MKKQETQKRKHDGTGVKDLPFRWIKLGVAHPPPIAQPRNGVDYERFETPEIFARIERDIKELVARAYHQSVDDWPACPSATESEPQTALAKRHEDTRASITKGLHSKDEAEREKAERMRRDLRALELAYAEDARRAAIYLALTGRSLASRLELLSGERLELLRPIARKFITWPFNLGLSKPDKHGRRKFQRSDLAEKNLRRLEVNADFYWPDSKSPADASASPFRLAAEEIYAWLRTVRSEPFKWFARYETLDEFKARWKPAKPGKFTKFKGGWRWKPGERTRLASPIPLPQWARDVIELKEPMTKANAGEWWAVAKFLLDEIWKKNREAFSHLIRHLDLDDPNYTPSLVRKQVIDDSLKKVFKALAVQ